MTSYNIYPDLPKEPSAPLEPQSYCLSIIQSKQQGLLKLKERYAKKYSKYSKILVRLVWLNACLSGLSVATEISSVGNSEYFHWFAHKYPIGCGIFSWSDCQ